MAKTYDDLTKEEKGKFRTMQLWENNRIKVLSWYMYMIIALMILAFLVTFYKPTIFTTDFSVGYMLFAMGILIFMLLQQVLTFKKEKNRIFNLTKSENYDLFGLEEKEVKTSFKDVLKYIENKTRSKVEE